MKQLILFFIFFNVLVSIGRADVNDGLYLRSLSIAVDKDVKGSYNSRVSVFFIYDRELLETLPETSSEWFAVEQELIRDYKGKIDIVSLSLGPGEVLRDIPLPSRSRNAISMGVFVKRPMTSMSSMANLHLNRDPVIYIGKDGFNVFEDPNFKKQKNEIKCALVL